MNLQQIIEQVNTDLDDTLENAVITGWVNRAMDIISAVTRYEKRVTLLFEDGVGDYPLPPDCLKLMHVIGDSGELPLLKLTDRMSAGYKRWGNTIGFQNISGVSVDVYYQARLPHLVTPDDEPVIPPQFHDLFILYAVARAKYQDEEEGLVLQRDANNEFGRRVEDLRKYYAQQETYHIDAVYTM
ncbi:hypothetical protein [Ectobacillus antri]|uniref:phage adaptor protein n=1 Tax=Ectobacillus antri TaxID=2486280 RepID=UPI000F5A5D33|nr:hypothetical protein [Ectobacillus antri]